MMQYLLETGLTNALLVTVLAGMVWGITRVIRHPLIVSILWMAVLMKLVTPAMFAYAVPWPVETPSEVIDNQVASIHSPVKTKLPLQLGLPDEDYKADEFKNLEPDVDHPEDFQQLPLHSEYQVDAAPSIPVPDKPILKVAPQAQGNIPTDTLKVIAQNQLEARRNQLNNEVLKEEFTPDAVQSEEKQITFWSQPRLWLGLWLSGSFLWIVLILYRSWKFGKLVRLAEQEEEQLQTLCDKLSERMGLGWKPPVRVVEAEIAPMIWAFGRETVILFPKHFLEELTIEKQQMVLAHELAHLKRRDHQLRWLELLVLSLYWWLPTVRFVRRQLHNAQEECCDAWVLRLFPEQQVQYGETLLSAATLLGEISRPPLLASEFGQKQSLKTRIETMLKNNTLRPLSKTGLVSCLLMVGLMLVVSVRWGEADEKSPREEITNNNQQTEKELVEPEPEVKKQIEEGKAKLERQLRKKRENISERAGDDDEDDGRRGGRFREVSKIENSNSGAKEIDSILDPVLEMLDHESEDIRIDGVRILRLYASDQQDRIRSLAREKGIERENIKLNQNTQNRLDKIESRLHSLENKDSSQKVRAEASRCWFELASLSKTPQEYYEFVWKTRLELMIDAPEDWHKLIPSSNNIKLELMSSASIPNAFKNLIWRELDEKSRADKKNKLLTFLLEETLKECRLFLKGHDKDGISFGEHVTTFNKVETYFNNLDKTSIQFVNQCAIPAISSSPEFIEQIIKTADNCSEEDRAIYANLLAKIAEQTNSEMKTIIINRYLKSEYDEFRRAMMNTLRNTFNKEKLSVERGRSSNLDFNIKNTSNMSRREREEYEKELQQALLRNNQQNPGEIRIISSPNLAPLKKLLNDPDPEVRAFAIAKYKALAPEESLINEVFSFYNKRNKEDHLAATARLFHWLENNADVDSKSYREELTKRIALLASKLTDEELYQLFADLFKLGQKQQWSIEELGEFYPGTISYLEELKENTPENTLQEDNTQDVLNLPDKSPSFLLTQHIRLNSETKMYPLIGEATINLLRKLTYGEITSLPINKLLENMVKTSPTFFKIATDFAYRTDNQQHINLIAGWIEKCSMQGITIDHAMRSKHPQIRKAAITAFSNSIQESKETSGGRRFGRAR